MANIAHLASHTGQFLSENGYFTHAETMLLKAHTELTEVGGLSNLGGEGMRKCLEKNLEIIRYTIDIKITTKCYILAKILSLPLPI